MYIITGKVVEGRRLGHTLGFPTANLELNSEFDGENGVYYSKIILDDGRKYNGVTNIGTNPTIEATKGVTIRRAESHILEFDEDIYGKRITVELVDKIRSEMRFESVEALQEQVLRDIEKAKAASRR